MAEVQVARLLNDIDELTIDSETRVSEMRASETRISDTESQLKALTALQTYARQIARKEFSYNIMSPQVNELVKSIVEFKKNMPEMKTDKTAGGRYRYQSFPALISAISSDLAKYNISFFQPIHTLGDKTYVISLLLHTSGQYIRSLTIIPDKYTMAGKVINTNENLQAMGGAITYTKRHALKSLLGIDADDDTDGSSPDVRSNGTTQSYAKIGYSNQ
jgi:hypothetical protein